MLSHIRGGEIIRKYTEAKGRVTLEHGDTVSPPVAGYINGNDKIVPVVDETVDNSTGPNVNRSVVETVEADRVLRTITITDAPVPIPDPKLVGIEFQGVRCSATKDDQSGLMAVLMAIQLQGAGFPPTQFEFGNGSVMVISLANYQAFLQTWLPFRQSFFAV